MWYHVSFSPVEKFEPRVPKLTYETENRTIKRICVSSSLPKAFRAAPQMGNMLKLLLSNNIQPIIYIYRFYKNDFKRDEYKTPEEILEYVGDAVTNEEYWLLKAPTRVSCQKVYVYDAKLTFMADMFGKKEYFCLWPWIKNTRTKKSNEDIINAYFKNKKYKEYVEEILKASLDFRSKLIYLEEEQLIMKGEDSDVCKNAAS
jgi:hypothetical protein